MAQRIVDMYEDDTLVVRHIFYGDDEKEAKHMEESHRKADKSLNAALSGKDYHGVTITATRPKAVFKARLMKLRRV